LQADNSVLVNFPNVGNSVAVPLSLLVPGVNDLKIVSYEVVNGIAHTVELPFSVNVSKLQVSGVSFVQPSGVSLTTNRDVFVNWSELGDGFIPPTYAVTLFNGTNTTVYYDVGVGFLYNLSASELGGQIVYVDGTDGVANVSLVGSPFAVSLVPNITGLCGIVYPNEADAPSVAVVNATFVVDSAFPISSAVSSGGLSSAGLCTNVSYNGITTFTCPYVLHYYQSAGSYPALLNITAGSHNVAYSAVCSVGQLLASHRVTLSLSFDPVSLPRPIPASGPLVVRNTGNVPFNLSLTAFDLSGSGSYGAVLPASAFKVGRSLPLSVWMADGVTKDVNVSVLPSLNATGLVYFWLANAGASDSYATTTPWSLQVVG
jgi:hypothetical protein